MTDQFDTYRGSRPSLPDWLADDLGVHPDTQLRPVRRRTAPRWSKLATRAFRRPEVDEAMAQVPLFDGLSRRQLQLASKLSTPCVIPASTTIASEGTRGREFFVVLDGEVEVRRGDQVVATRGPGSHLGETALLTHEPRNATLVTTTSVSVRVASEEEFDGLVRAIPEISQRLHAAMVERAA